MAERIKLQQKTEFMWEIPREGGMQVPGRIYATAEMMEAIRSDNAPQQVMNVAHLPGIVKASLAMPDCHWGYGFSIGGVAAFDPATGVVSPGGVGYDINCGVRLMASGLSVDEVRPRLSRLVDTLFERVPTGVGVKGRLTLDGRQQREIVHGGAGWAIANGYGDEEELGFIEEGGCVGGAEPGAVSAKAFERGQFQMGTLGSGNHFLEVGYVHEIYDDEAAAAFGLAIGQVTAIIHCGSRGFGYQICDDSIATMNRACRKYGIELPDRQLCCAPIASPEGEHYFGAMNCGINYAFANRQVIAEWTRQAFVDALGIDRRTVALRTVYEVAHNIAKMERHVVDGKERELCVHRKGATRAFGPGHADVPERYRQVGQPVLIPGDMGRYSYVLTGAEGAMRNTFGSTCHGAGRAMSRTQAKKSSQGREIQQELARRGIVVRASSSRTMHEEISEAYKDVTEVVDTCEGAGISRKVAQLRPLGCIKG